MPLLPEHLTTTKANTTFNGKVAEDGVRVGQCWIPRVEWKVSMAKFEKTEDATK